MISLESRHAACYDRRFDELEPRATRQHQPNYPEVRVENTGSGPFHPDLVILAAKTWPGLLTADPSRNPNDGACLYIWISTHVACLTIIVE